MGRVTTAYYGVATQIVWIVDRITITRCSDALCKLLEKPQNLKSQRLPTKPLSPGSTILDPNENALNSEYQSPNLDLKNDLPSISCSS